MEQWLKDYFTGSLLLVFAVGITRYGPRAWAAFKTYRAAVKKIHETERETAVTFERAERATALALANKSGEHESTLRKLAEVQAELLTLTRQLEIKDDLNRQDRIGHQIYRRHLRECGHDLAEIEREIRTAIVKYFYERGAPTDK